MTTITQFIFFAYAVLILISLFLDPKRHKAKSKSACSIVHMLLFSSFKMFLVIGIVLVGAAFQKISLFKVFGLSGFSLNTEALGLGVVAAFGFVVIYLVWQWVRSNVFIKRLQPENTRSDIIDALPKHLLHLIAIFAIISLEAAVLEEIFFRGIMQSNFSGFFITPWAIAASGLLFGLAHFYQGFTGIVGISLLGLWLGVTFAVTGNLFVPIVGHFLGDLSCMILGAPRIIHPESQEKCNRATPQR